MARLQSSTATLVVDLLGGSIGDFTLAKKPMNPLSWGTPARGDMAIRGFGHFLCLDRWGPPSEAEGKRGVPYHGEAANVPWVLSRPVQTNDHAIEATLRAKLPLARMAVTRTIRLSRTQPVALIREEVKNEGELGRIFNMVQHPTIAPPFLSDETVVDCNGSTGFAQGNPMPHPTEPSFKWPSARDKSNPDVDMRRLMSNPNPNVVSYMIDEPFGWVTAINPREGLLIGYLWKTSDYPWVSHWRDVREGKPAARGLEFGTTGLHQPFPILVEAGRPSGRRLFEFLDADESRAKSYLIFLAEVPPDFSGVGEVSFSNARLVLRERKSASTSARGLTIEIPASLQP